MADLIDYRQIYPGSKGRQHFPALLAQSGVGYDQMCFWDDCSYGDNCAEVASRCAGVSGSPVAAGRSRSSRASRCALPASRPVTPPPSSIAPLEASR